MGLLGGLFEKKNCDICGQKIGLLGNRKLEDGNLCKDCAAKLSPWFSERRHSTLEDIRAQLEYREKNLEAVRAFHPTKTFGKGVKLLVDENARKFAVTGATDLLKANPDILDCADAWDCRLDVQESRTEEKQTKDGKQVSYNPPRYKYSYNFYCTILVNHPYFDDMRFSLNTGSVSTGNRSMTQGSMGNGWSVSLMGNIRETVVTQEYNSYIRMGDTIKAEVDSWKNAPAPAPEEPEKTGADMVQEMIRKREKAMQEYQNRFAAIDKASLAAEAAAAAGITAAQGQAFLDNMAAILPQAVENGTWNDQKAMEAKAAQMTGIAEVTGSAFYQRYNDLLQKQMSTGTQPEAEAGRSQGAAPVKVRCPFCESMTTIRADGSCEFCGGPLR